MSKNAPINIPNFLTVLRIGLVPVFLWFVLEGRLFEAALVYGLAGITDALDGIIARRFDMRTELGAWLDPMADKLLQLAAYCVLAYEGLVPVLLTVLVVGRDAAIVAVLVFLKRTVGKVKILPTKAGKLSTILQVVTVLYVLLVGSDPPILYWTVIATVTAITLYSAVDYARVGVGIYQRRDGAGGRG